MANPKQPDVYLELALQALRRIPKFLAKRSLAEYLGDDLIQAAVERQLEIAGDALGQLRKVDPALFAKIPDANLIVGFRNVLAHGYATLDHRRVHAIASANVESLEKVLASLLADIPERGAQR
jgi:uncharacterized protein with HEPN domain